MTLAFTSTNERRRGYRAGTTINVAPPVIPAAPVLGAITNPTGTVQRVAITAVDAVATFITREVSINGAAYISAGGDVAKGSAFFEYDVGSATSWAFRSKAGNDGGLSTLYSNVVSGSTTTATDRTKIAYFQNAEALNVGAVGPTHNSVVSLDQSYSGTKSFKTHFTSGSIAPQGLNIDFYDMLGFAPAVGDEAWFSFRLFVPVTVNWNATPGWLKWLRFRVSRGGASETNIRGIYSLLKSNGTLDYVYEGINTQFTLVAATNNAPLIGTWETREIHCVFDTVSKDAGGKGEFFFYKDGLLLGHMTNQFTMNFADDHCHEFSWIDYWNGGPHATFDTYVDDLCAAVKIAGHRDDSVWLATDLAGNKYIGL